MPVPALVFRDSKLLLVAGDATTNEDCCCDPCSCYADYSTTLLPASGTIETPLGNAALTKKPTLNDCSGKCVDIDGTTYIYWSCNYFIAKVESCTRSVCVADKTCDTTTVEEDPPQTVRLLVEMFGHIHFVFRQIFGNGNLRIEKRLNCQTGIWQAKVTMDYLISQLVDAHWKGTERTRQYVNGVLTQDNTIEYWAGVSNFCLPYNSDNENQLGVFRWVPSFDNCNSSSETYFGEGFARITASTAWFSTAANISGSVVFPTTIGPLIGGTTYQLISFLSPTTFPNPFTCFEGSPIAVFDATGVISYTRCGATDANTNYGNHVVTF